MARVLRLGLAMLRRAGIQSAMIRDRELWAIGLSLQWQADDSVLSGAVHEHELDGQRVRFFVTDHGDALQQDHVAGRWYEARELEFIRHAYRAGTFVDVGAGLGNHSLFAGLVLGAPRIVAFEPAPLAWRICDTNIRLNGLSGRATVHRMGLSDRDQMASVSRVRPSNIGATALSPAPDGTLPLKRGDPLLADEAIGFLKIDVEGHEMQVLAGLAQTIVRDRPPLLVEVDHANRNAFEAWLATAPYSVYEAIGRSENTNFLLLPAAGDPRYLPKVEGSLTRRK